MFWEQDKNVPSQHSLFTVVLETIGSEIRKGNKIQTGKEEIKLFLFSNNVSIYIENPRELATLTTAKNPPGTNKQL